MAGPWTNFPNGITSMGIPIVGGSLPPFMGNYFFVDYTNGLDGNPGTAYRPFKTLERALELCTANNNDVIFFEGTVRPRSDATITWSKAQTHLVGLGAPLKRGKRARIAPASGAVAYNKLFSVTAPGCMFLNFGTFYGFDSASALICWEDTGGRSYYGNIEFLGFGNGTAGTGTANLTGARAFKMNTSTGESTFKDCVFGVDTVVRDATNYTVEIAGGAPRITMEGCDFESMLGSSGGGAAHLLIGSGGIDRYLLLKGCTFMSATKSTGTAMAQAMNLSASAGGFVFADEMTKAFGITNWETASSGTLIGSHADISPVDSGLGEVVTPT